jgi:hypothetical protein
MRTSRSSGIYPSYDADFSKAQSPQPISNDMPCRLNNEEKIVPR